MFTEEIGYIFTWKIDKTVRYLDCKLRKIKKWSNDKMFHLVCSFMDATLLECLTYAKEKEDSR